MNRAPTTTSSDAPVKATIHCSEASKHTVVPDHIRRVANLLAGNSQKKRSDLRQHLRHAIISPCTVTLDVDGSGVLQHVEAYIRNLSVGGVGLLMREPHLSGEVIEIRIDINGTPKYVCGAIAFCRHIEGNVHEVGVQLFQCSPAPQLPELATMPRERTPDWFRTAHARLAVARGFPTPPSDE